VKAKAAIVQRLKRMENITVRPSSRIYGRILRSISNANPIGGIKPCDNAAFGDQPQGYGVTNRLAKRPGGRQSSRPSLKTLSVWRYRDQWRQ
jgi:hypothetical protein